jgi:hypothetical protein
MGSLKFLGENMKRTLGVRLFLFISVLVTISLACEFSGSTETSKGERAISNENGFSFTPPTGTIVNNQGFIGIDVSASNAEKSGDFVIGPKCFATTDQSRTNIKDGLQRYWTSAVASEKSNAGLDLSSYQETSVSDHYALESEETGTYLASIDSKGTPIYGKRLDVQLEGDQVFWLTCDGPVSRKDETISLYDGLKGSLQFFAPITPTPGK